MTEANTAHELSIRRNGGLQIDPNMIRILYSRWENVFTPEWASSVYLLISYDVKLNITRNLISHFSRDITLDETAR